MSDCENIKESSEQPQGMHISFFSIDGKQRFRIGNPHLNHCCQTVLLSICRLVRRAGWTYHRTAVDGPATLAEYYKKQ